MLVGRSFYFRIEGMESDATSGFCLICLNFISTCTHVQTDSVQTGGQRGSGGLDLLSRLWMVGLRGAVVCKKST